MIADFAGFNNIHIFALQIAKAAERCPASPPACAGLANDKGTQRCCLLYNYSNQHFQNSISVKCIAAHRAQ